MRALIAAAAKSGGIDSARPTSQVAVIKASVHALATTIRSDRQAVRANPGLAAIKASAEQFTASVDSVESSVTALEGKSGQAKVNALARVASAPALLLGAMGQTIDTAAKDGKSALAQAFAAAPRATR